MKRVALLLGTNERNDDIYNSVQADLDNIIAFLKSPCGGAWAEKTQIMDCRAANKKQILDLIDRINASVIDYCFIYFSGHGRIVKQTKSKIYMLNRNEEISLDQLKTKSLRNLIITDACRKHSDDDYSNFVSETIEFPSIISANNAINLFLDQIKSTPYGTVHINSCQDDKVAYSINNGGHYTLSLLYSIIEWINTPEKFNVLPIDNAFVFSNEYLRKIYHSNPQAPEIESSAGDLRFPIAFK